MGSPSRSVGIAFVLLTLVPLACDQPSGGTSANAGRSEAVTAASDMPSAAPSVPASTPSSHAAAPTARNLCESDLARPGRKLPKPAFAPIAAPGAAPPSSRIPAGEGRWTWINFFASWCGPCKEEMPRLRGFEQRLATHLQVSFVSLDDDDRLLKKFLDTQAASGVRSAMWLPPGKAREAWLAAFQMSDPPDLPAHVLVDPAGKVRCVVGGAIDDADFSRIASIVDH